MTGPSKRALAAGRAARGSTGPRTTAGKARSAQNARKHGLAAAISAGHEGDANEMAAELVGHSVNADCFETALAFACARLQLERVRAVRETILDARIGALKTEGNGTDVVSTFLAEAGEHGFEWLAGLLAELLPLARYEKRALSCARKAACGLRRHKVQL